MEPIFLCMCKKDGYVSMRLYICKPVHSRITDHRASYKTEAYTFQAHHLEFKTALILIICLCSKQTNKIIIIILKEHSNFFQSYRKKYQTHVCPWKTHAWTSERDLDLKHWIAEQVLLNMDFILMTLIIHHKSRNRRWLNIAFLHPIVIAM